jgi:hypothetical protein
MHAQCKPRMNRPNKEIPRNFKSNFITWQVTVTAFVNGLKKPKAIESILLKVYSFLVFTIYLRSTR